MARRGRAEQALGPNPMQLVEPQDRFLDQIVRAARARGETDGDRFLGQPILRGNLLLRVLIEMDDALARLEPRQARLVELRYFGGLTIEEAATELGVAPATAKRDWAIARAWLRRRLGPETTP